MRRLYFQTSTRPATLNQAPFRASIYAAHHAWLIFKAPSHIFLTQLTKKPVFSHLYVVYCSAHHPQVVDGAMRAEVAWRSLPGLRGTLTASLSHSGLLPVTQLHVTGELWVMCDDDVCLDQMWALFQILLAENEMKGRVLAVL